MRLHLCLQVAAEKIADYFAGSELPDIDEKYSKHTVIELSENILVIYKVN